MCSKLSHREGSHNAFLSRSRMSFMYLVAADRFQLGQYEKVALKAGLSVCVLREILEDKK